MSQTVETVMSILFAVILVFAGLMAVRGHNDPERLEGWRRYKEDQRKREEN